MMITKDALLAGTGCRSATADVWLAPVQSACDRFGINTPRSIAALLANVGVESGGLMFFVENMNYSAQGLANTWPTRFSTTGSAPARPNSLANSLAHNQEAIANYVYANRMGNGDVQSGDGWKFRGQGPIQLTGRDNITRFGKTVGLDLASDPSPLRQPTVGALSAAWLFLTRGCVIPANAGDINKVIQLINGAPPNSANQGSLRASRYTGALNILTA